MEQRIRELFATVLQVPPNKIGDGTRPDDIERWDSMKHMILVSGMEEEFGVEFEPEEAIEMFSDFATFKRIILQKLALKK